MGAQKLCFSDYVFYNSVWNSWKVYMKVQIILKWQTKPATLLGLNYDTCNF